MSEFLPKILCIVSLTVGIKIGHSYSFPTLPQRPSTFLFSSTDSITMKPETQAYPEYTQDQLKAALDSLLEGSTDPSYDARHILGFQDPNHKLSKLQQITATRILDYETYLVGYKNNVMKNVLSCKYHTDRIPALMAQSSSAPFF